MNSHLDLDTMAFFPTYQHVTYIVHEICLLSVAFKPSLPSADDSRDFESRKERMENRLFAIWANRHPVLY